MEALLVGMYNLEVVDENSEPRVVSFRLPSLAQASLYHEVSRLWFHLCIHMQIQFLICFYLV